MAAHRPPFLGTDIPLTSYNTQTGIILQWESCPKETIPHSKNRSEDLRCVRVRPTVRVTSTERRGRANRKPAKTSDLKKLVAELFVRNVSLTRRVSRMPWYPLRICGASPRNPRRSRCLREGIPPDRWQFREQLRDRPWK